MVKRAEQPSRSSNFKVGEIVEVYSNPMLQEDFLGKACLLEKITEASFKEAFVVEETGVSNQKVYALETWKLEFKEVAEYGRRLNISPGDIQNRPLKFLFNIGPTPCGVVNIYEMEGRYSDNIAYKKPTIIDNFEAVEGWGQQF